jgi:hypothetical protein
MTELLWRLLLGACGSLEVSAILIVSLVVCTYSGIWLYRGRRLASQTPLGPIYIPKSLSG